LSFWSTLFQPLSSFSVICWQQNSLTTFPSPVNVDSNRYDSVEAGEVKALWKCAEVHLTFHCHLFICFEYITNSHNSQLSDGLKPINFVSGIWKFKKQMNWASETKHQIKFGWLKTTGLYTMSFPKLSLAGTASTFWLSGPLPVNADNNGYDSDCKWSLKSTLDRREGGPSVRFCVNASRLMTMIVAWLWH